MGVALSALALLPVFSHLTPDLQMGFMHWRPDSGWRLR